MVGLSDLIQQLTTSGALEHVVYLYSTTTTSGWATVDPDHRFAATTTARHNRLIDSRYVPHDTVRPSTRMFWITTLP